MDCKKLKLDCEEETGQGTEREDWDGLPQEVLNMFFKHLPVADLLSCSVVSKNWKKASRDVLKRDRECYAYIRDFPEDLQDLNDMISSKDFTQMFNGLNMRIGSGDPDDEGTAWKQDFSCTNAENMLQSKATRRRLEKAKRKLRAVMCAEWKYLNLDMEDDWDQVLSIDDALLLREVISATRESLLKLVGGRDLVCDFMSCCGKEFSKLKVLQIQDEDTLEDSCLEKFVLEFAPNLEEITGKMLRVEIHSPGNPFMLKRMKSIYVAPDDVIPQAGLMESFRYVSGLYRLNLQLFHCTNSDDVSVLFSMVLRSLNTLEELHMRIIDFYKFLKMADDIKFPNIRRLNLDTPWDLPVGDQIVVLKLLNLPNLIPKLEHVELSVDICRASYREIEEIPYEGPDRLDQSDLPLQINFTCREARYEHEQLKFFNRIYPKMNKVQVLGWRPDDNYEMNSIFSDLCSLEYLEINVSPRFPCYSSGVTIAAILCGINIEEAELLCGGFPWTSANLNPCIVPIRPSLFNAKNLKELKITGDRYSPGASFNYSWVIQITENLPVRHVRKLEVTFEGTEASFYKLALKTLLSAQVKEN